MGEPHDGLHQLGTQRTCRTGAQVLGHGQKPASKAKQDLYMQLFSLFLDSEAEQEHALLKSDLKKTAAEDVQEDLSDYDLIEQAETGNLGDPDLKSEKKKAKQTRAKAALKEAASLQSRAARARGRGRGKGRGKGQQHFPDLQRVKLKRKPGLRLKRRPEGLRLKQPGLRLKKRPGLRLKRKPEVWLLQLDADYVALLWMGQQVQAASRQRLPSEHQGFMNPPAYLLSFARQKECCS